MAAFLLFALSLWVIGYLSHHPVLYFSAIILGIASISNFEPGIQPAEIAYSIFFFIYITSWFLMRTLFYKERYLWETEDRLAILLIAWVSLSLVQTFLFRGNALSAAQEWYTFLLLALYFPVKEICIRYETGPGIVVGLIMVLGTYIAIRNLEHFQSILHSATAAWQIAGGRVVTNETYLLLPALISLVLLLSSRHFWQRLLSASMLLLFSIALIVTQSRAYWIDFVIGLVVIVILSTQAQRATFVRWSFIFIIGILALGVYMFGSASLLIGSGIVNRVASIGTATSSDLSFLNRVYESRDVFRLIALNPIIGYGPGVSYSAYDIIDHVTITKTYVHNGVFMIWFKYGLVGLIILISFWLRNIWIAFRARRDLSSSALSPYALIALAGLVAIIPSALTSVPFYTSDTMLGFSVLAGLASGVHTRGIQHVHGDIA